jgi:hypothetical protein
LAQRVSNPAQSSPTFQKLFCQSRGCNDARFAEVALDETLHRRVWWLNRLLRPFVPGLFAGELRLLRDLGQCSAAREVHAEYCSRRERGMSSKFSLGARLRLRISGDRLMRIVKRVFDGAN